METVQDTIGLVESLNQLLQEVHFRARDLAQYAPAHDDPSLADQIHRIRMLALQLRSELAAAHA